MIIGKGRGKLLIFCKSRKRADLRHSKAKSQIRRVGRVGDSAALLAHTSMAARATMAVA